MSFSREKYTLFILVLRDHTRDLRAAVQERGFKMVAETLAEKIVTSWLSLRELCGTLLDHAYSFWSISDWQVRVCLIVSVMLLLNVVLIGISWHVYGSAISQMYSSKASRNNSPSLRAYQAMDQEVIRKKID